MLVVIETGKLNDTPRKRWEQRQDQPRQAHGESGGRNAVNGRGRYQRTGNSFYQGTRYM